MRKLDTEALYRLLARQVDTMPTFPYGQPLSTEDHRWLAQTNALIEAQGSVAEGILLKSGVRQLNSTVFHESAVDDIKAALFRAVAKAELQAPASVQGSFIAAGQELDAYAAIAKALGSAHTDLLMVDPYLDASAVFEFVPLAPEGISVRLLSDGHSVKETLEPAVRRWKEQHPQRSSQLSARVTGPRMLHDRLVIVDRAEAWILTQSFKDFAARSPASLTRTDGEAARLKVQFYESLWEESQQLGGQG